MSVAHPRSSMFVICLFFSSAPSFAMPATTPMLETATEMDKCEWNRPDGTGEHNDQSCYLLISEGMTFYQANQSCVDEGAHLVSIGNQDENDLVHRLTKNTESWIGLHRMTNEICAGSSCSWMWLDGSDLEYDMWPIGITAGITQCVYMNAIGKWDYSRECSTNLSSVCKKSIPSTTTPEPTTKAITSEMTGTSLSNSVRPGGPEERKNIVTTEDKMPIIIGCVVGGLALVVIVTVVAVVLLKRHRTSRPIDQPVEVMDEETPKVDKPVRYNPAYEDVEPNVTFKPSPGNTDTGTPGNTDTGTPGNTDTGAHGVGDNPHNIYSKARKKEDRPGSEGILVNENTLYGYGK